MKRILIAEDDDISRKLMCMLLSPFGECDEVTDGLEAIKAYRQAMKEKRPYDLICMDIMMPKLDGVKVIRAIREMEVNTFILPEKRAKIIITTAFTVAELVKEAYRYGVEAYVQKPIKKADITGLITKLGFA